MWLLCMVMWQTYIVIRAAKLFSAICRDATHTAFFVNRSVKQDVMLADLDVLSADDHCRTAHARRYARQAAGATAAALCVHNHPCSPEFDVELSAAYAQEYMRAAVWNGLHRVQWSEDKIKADPFLGRSRVRFRVPPCRPQLHVTASLRTGGGPVSCVQLSEGGFQVVYPLSLWSWFSGVVKVRFGYG